MSSMQEYRFLILLINILPCEAALLINGKARTVLIKLESKEHRKLKCMKKVLDIFYTHSSFSKLNKNITS